MESSDEEKPRKRRRIENLDDTTQPSTSDGNHSKSNSPLDQMDESILNMKVEDLLLLMINDPKGTFSCPFKMGVFYNNFLQYILSMFKNVYAAYTEQINYLKDKISTSYYHLSDNLDIEKFGDFMLEKYENVVNSELSLLPRLSDDKRRETYVSLFRGIDNKLIKLINLKNIVTESLTNVEPQPVFDEMMGNMTEEGYVDNDNDIVLLDEETDEKISYPMLYTHTPIIIIEAEKMTNIFNQSTVKRLVQLSLEEHENFQNPAGIITEANNECLYPLLPAAPIEIVEENENVSDYTNIFEELQSRVTCLKILKDLCLIGCADGVLRLGSLESNTIIDSFQAHTLMISSITTWQRQIFTTSLDSTIRCFNLETQTVKKLVFPHSPTCADHDGDGILHVGTSEGFIYKLNMLALTIITPFIHLGTTSIESIIILRADHPIIRKMIVCMDSVVTLRDCSSGEVLLTLRFDNTKLCDYSPMTNKIFATSENSIYRANSLSNDSRVIQLLPFPNGGTSIMYSNGFILVADNDGNTSVYDEELNLIKHLKGYQNDIITCMVPWRQFVISYFSESGCIGKAIFRGEPV